MTKHDIFATMKKKAISENVNVYLHITETQAHIGYDLLFDGQRAHLKYTSEGKMIL